MSYNQITVTGNLARDVELKKLAKNKVASFIIAINDRFVKDKAHFVEVEVWDKLAELCHEHLSKGRKVLVGGRIYQDTWSNEDGEKRSKLYIKGEQVEFLTPKDSSKTQPSSAGENGSSTSVDDDEDIPF
jgi:single-strand DNA-binding protein